MSYLCYTLDEAAQQLGMSDTVLFRLSQFLKVPASAYDDVGYIAFNGDLSFTEDDIAFFRRVKERLLKGESLETVKLRLRQTPSTPVQNVSNSPSTASALGIPRASASNTANSSLLLAAPSGQQELNTIHTDKHLKREADKSFHQYKVQNRSRLNRVFQNLADNITKGVSQFTTKPLMDIAFTTSQPLGLSNFRVELPPPQIFAMTPSQEPKQPVEKMSAIPPVPKQEPVSAKEETPELEESLSLYAAPAVNTPEKVDWPTIEKLEPTVAITAKPSFKPNLPAFQPAFQPFFQTPATSQGPLPIASNLSQPSHQQQGKAFQPQALLSQTLPPSAQPAVLAANGQKPKAPTVVLPSSLNTPHPELQKTELIQTPLKEQAPKSPAAQTPARFGTGVKPSSLSSLHPVAAVAINPPKEDIRQETFPGNQSAFEDDTPWMPAIQSSIESPRALNIRLRAAAQTIRQRAITKLEKQNSPI